jgi:hypothetical protein
MPTYALTYDVITPESAERGDIAESGFEREPVEIKRGSEFSLADAIREARFEGCEQTGDIDTADFDRREISLYSDYDVVSYRTGAEKSHCAHFKGFTPSTLRRIVRAITKRPVRTPLR